MDWFLIYIIALYVIIIPLASWGALSPQFDANMLQRIALCMVALWAAWRISLMLQHGWGFPHEPLVATALALYALGTLQKALGYRRRACRE
ncbi:hypothetical protein [Paracandidimonas lactea]|uniref:hypothetical protein n=1 Tax=Paracandidimonas lactea TaxID=2895524 RepID=UPI001F369813|nr:hypothetical protein [Paracandidimonas lactea]